MRILESFLMKRIFKEIVAPSKYLKIQILLNFVFCFFFSRTHGILDFFEISLRFDKIAEYVMGFVVIMQNHS